MARIAIISMMNGAAWGGSEALWSHVAMQLHAQGHVVSCSVYKRSHDHRRVAALRAAGVSVESRGNVRGHATWAKVQAAVTQRFTAAEQLRCFVRKSAPDHILISLGTFLEALLPAHVEFLSTLNIPFHLVVHNNLESTTYPVRVMDQAAHILERSAGNWFVSQRLATQVARQIAYDIPRMQLVANPPNIENDSPLQWDFSDNDRVHVAFIGALIPTKGLPLLLQVLARPEWRRRPLSLSVYGEGLECPALRYTAERWSLSDTVRFVGFTDDIRSVWKTHQALLLPSFHEGMPIVIHEAMLLNRVCVVTEVGGASEVIADGASGFLAPSASYDHFAQAMERWWHQRGRWRAIAEAAGLAVRQWRGQHPLDRLVAALSG